MENNNRSTDASALADLIDDLMNGGSGHINITSDSADGDISVKTYKSTDCSGIKGACCQPTESDGDE